MVFKLLHFQIINLLTLLAFIFYFFVVLTVGSALVVLLSRNVLYSAFSLLLTFLGMAALYITAGGDFLAVTQIMVYVGGVLVLMIFGIMLTNKTKIKQAALVPNVIVSEHRNTFWGLVLAVGIFSVLVWAFRNASFARLEVHHFDSQPLTSKVNGIGIQLMTDFSLPFEITGVLLMIALMGAAYLAKENK